MKTPLLAWIGMVALALGNASELAAQRGSKGSSQGSSQGSGSRGSQQGSSSASRPSSSQGSRGSGGSAPSRPSSSSQGSSRGSSPSGGSVRPSSPPSPRPTASSPTVRPSTPSPAPSSGGSASRPSAAPSPSASGSSSAGRELYSGRAQPANPAAPTGSSAPTSTAPSTTTGNAGEPRSLVPTGASPGVSIPPERTSRPRFPAAYSPAGSAATPGRTVQPGSAPSPAPRGVVRTPTRGPESKDGRPTKSGPVVRYGEGPTRRVEVPKTTLTRPEPRAPTIGKGPAGKDDKGSGFGKGPGGNLAADRPVKTKSLGDLKRDAPKKLDDVRVLTRGISRAHDLATGVAFGALGGVRPSGYYGGLPLDGDGYHGNDWYSPWYGNSWCWWGGTWWGSSCYFSWYYPWWWWCSRPYYASYYAYWPVTTVIYADDDPEVIYIERESAPANEPVGEAVVGAPAQPGVAPSVPSADSPLSIAAQRYLELGDRAFREGRYADAVQFYAKAVEFAPDQGALYLVLADALFAAGDYHYGAYAVRRALELDPALVESSVDKHGFYPDPAHFDAQLAKLEQFLTEHPGDRDARLVLALNYLFGGRARDAVRTIDSAVGAMAEDAAAQKILARAKTVAGS